MVAAPYLLLLSGCVLWTVSRANSRGRNRESFPLLSEENGLPAGDVNELGDPILTGSVKTEVTKRHRIQPAFTGDYDVIEVIQNGSVADYGEEIGFSAVKEKFCAAECIRGLSGLCICPPPDTTSDVSLITTSRPPTPSSSSPSRHTLHHPRRERTNKKVESYFSFSTSLEEPSDKMVLREGAARYLRVKRGDDDDEEDQKLCKCRRCRKLFKRTLYCRVFPCYQKKCKSGEWRATDRESTPPSNAH